VAAFALHNGKVQNLQQALCGPKPQILQFVLEQKNPYLMVPFS
jgi:hypothetical protein